MEENNSLEKTNSNNSITVNENTPLLNYPSLTIGDVNNAIMTPLHREVILASQNHPKISNSDQSEARDGLIEILAIIIWESGVASLLDDKKEQKILINYMVEEIKKDFFHLTLPEVQIALKKGLRGHYDTQYGINVKSLYGSLDNYVSETKIEAMTAFNKLLKPKEEYKGLNDEQKAIVYRKWLESFIILFEKYHEGENIEITDIGNVFYKYCTRNKIGSLSDKQKIELENKAKRVVVSKGNEYARSSHEVKELRELVNSINKNKYDEDIELRIVSEAKRLAILVFFDKLIEDKIELGDLIKKIEKW
jgi:hypothetical protein